MNRKIDEQVLNKALEWTKPPFDIQTQNKVKYLIENDKKNLFESFHKNISFGTGGIREIMGVGTNRINKYTISLITQGFSNYLKQNYKDTPLTIAIAFDCRNNSPYFAQQAANILSANGIKAFLFEQLAPTPLLSFTIRRLNCNGGIVITASHNPKEYNGYKVYEQSGAQITPPRDKELLRHINSVKVSDINFDSNQKLIYKLDNKIDNDFINESIKSLSNINTTKPKNINIVFTPLHGTSIRVIPNLLKKAQFKNLNILEEQSQVDGNFTNTNSVNPEEKQAFDRAIKLSKNINADIIIATDPDADRIGIAVRDNEKKFQILNGNQIGCIIVDYILDKLKQKKLLSKKNFISSTVVSSDIFIKIAESYSVDCKQTLTGFKWIGKIVRELEGREKIIVGVEESNGYMISDFVRDKDSLTSSLIISIIAQEDFENSKTLIDRLIDIYTKYGFFKDSLLNITKKGIQGREEIDKIMKNIRENKPKKILDSYVDEIIDFEDIFNSTQNKLNIYKKTTSNLIIIYTKDDTKIAIRPSNTEPKIKFYISIKTSLNKREDFEKTNHQLNQKMQKIKNYLQDKFVNIF